MRMVLAAYFSLGSHNEAMLACREEWSEFARNLGEVQEDYLERLRETFCFKKEIPPNGTSIRIQGIEVKLLPPLFSCTTAVEKSASGLPSPFFFAPSPDLKVIQWLMVK
jgi:hypothetical protein